MRRLFALGLVLVAGCGSNGSEKLPAPCSDGPEPVLKALAAAPGAVAMDGTPISRCFNRGASGDDEQILGTGLVGAAQQLADGARTDPRTALQLGYLVGAAERGAKRNGLGAEIVRRLQAEAAAAAPNPKAFDRGRRAGLAGG